MSGERKGNAVVTQTPLGPNKTLMTDRHGPFAEDKRGWVFWEIFLRTVALGLQFGAVFGATVGALFGLVVAAIYGLFVGALFGMAYGAALGLILGLPLGLVLAWVTCAWFYPSADGIRYRRVIWAVSMAISLIACLLSFWVHDGFTWVPSVLLPFVAVAAWLASRRLADWYVGVAGESAPVTEWEHHEMP